MKEFIIKVTVETNEKETKVNYKLLEDTFKGRTQELEKIKEKLTKDEELTNEEEELMTIFVILKQMEGVITTLQEQLG